MLRTDAGAWALTEEVMAELGFRAEVIAALKAGRRCDELE